MPSAKGDKFSKMPTTILGLTGSIGMGKSTVSKMFRKLGVPVFDADAECHRLQGPGGAAVGRIEAFFPKTTSPEKGVDRLALALRINTPKELGVLEGILHPAVEVARLEFLKTHEDKPLVVLDIPLLFEKGGWKKVDKIAVVSAPAAVQRTRVLARPGMTEERFEYILGLQTPDAEKRERADFVIDTNLSEEETFQQVQNLIQELSVCTA